MTKTLPARHALIGFLPRVDAFVRGQGCQLTEADATFVAFKGLLPGVDSFVFVQERPMSEAFPTDGTRIHSGFLR